MQFTTTLLAALAATGALALPQPRRAIDNTVTVSLASLTEDLAVGIQFNEVQFGTLEQRNVSGSRGPFQTVSLRVGKDVPQQNLRCQIIDEQGNPIPVNRGKSIGALTFADGSLNEWTLAQESIVETIICDPSFAAGTAAPAPAPAKGTQVTVALFGPGELATQTNFLQDGLVREQLPPQVSSGPYDTVELVLGDGKKSLRCQLINAFGHPIIVKRNAAIDVTFADGDVGPWKLLNAMWEPEAMEVKEIICDPAFVANSLN